MAPRFRTAALLLGLILAGGACEKREVPTAQRRDQSPGAKVPAPRATRGPAKQAPGPFLFARVDQKTVPVPARFTAPLPSSLDRFQADMSAYPPRALITASLCAGDADMQKRFADALARADTVGGLADPKLVGAFRGLTGYCRTAEKCDWLAAGVKSAPSPAIRRVYWNGLAECNRPAYLPAFARPDAPAGVVFDWYMRFYDRLPAGKNPRLLSAAAELLAAEDVYQVRKVGVVLGKLGEQGLALIQKLQGQTTDPERRAWLAVNLGGVKKPKAQELHRQACQHPKLKREPLCAPDYDPNRMATLMAKTKKPDPKEMAALRAKLLGLGLIPDAALPEGDPAPGSVRDFLQLHGRLTQFDTETGQFPNEHDGLLRELAALSAGVLDGAVFEEIAPANERGTYRLRAYLAGQRHEAVARNLGDWYDMEAVLGLLNSLLRDRGSELRYVTLHTRDQTASVLAGPAKGIEAAAAQGLIRLGGVSAAMNAGKAFEDKVFEQLKREGKQVYRDVPLGGADAVVEE